DGNDDRVEGLELEVLGYVTLLELLEVDRDLLAAPEQEPLLRIRGGRHAPVDRRGLEERHVVPRELEGARLREAAHEIHRPALDLPDDHGHRRGLHRPAVVLDGLVLQVLDSPTSGLDLTDEW